MWAKFWTYYVANVLLFCAVLFGAAGTVRWPAAWVFVVLLFGSALPLAVTLARRDPALMTERMRSPFHNEQPLWDRIYLFALAVLLISGLCVIGLDGGRYHWSMVPIWVQLIGGVGVLSVLVIEYLTLRVNTFAIAIVRIQADRGHKVVSTGPYAYIRHPMYAGAIVMFPSATFLLGSWYGLLVALALSSLLVLRTAMEDGELRRGLAGYAEYSRRVRYRLIPLIW
jgi:protein-S-isoprenylcysteine O-methyltransferase Ste14